MSPTSKTQIFDSSDARSPVAQELDERQRKAFLEKRKQELLASTRAAVDGARAAETEEASTAETIKFVAVAFAIVAVVALGSVYGIMWALDNF